LIAEGRRLNIYPTEANVDGSWKAISYQQKRWELPSDWKSAKKVKVFRITWEGLEEAGILDVVDGSITLSLPLGDAVKINL